MKKLKLKPTSIFNGLIFLSLILALTFFSAFRLEVGEDYNNYVYLFHYLGQGNEHWGSIELGFKTLVESIYFFTDDPRFLFIFFSVTTLTIFGVSWVKFSPSIIISIVIFVGLYHYFNSLNISRQYLAMAIVFLFGTDSLRAKKPINYLLACLVASFFHASAILMFFLYPFIIKRWSSYVYLLIFSFFIVLYLVYDYIKGFLFSRLGIYSSYADYMVGSANFLFLTSFILFCILWIYRERILGLNILSIVSFNLSFLSLCIIPFSNHNILFARIAMYLSVYFTISIPIVLGVMIRKNDRVFSLVILYLLMALNMTYHLYNNVGGILPYNLDF